MEQKSKNKITRILIKVLILFIIAFIIIAIVNINNDENLESNTTNTKESESNNNDNTQKNEITTFEATQILSEAYTKLMDLKTTIKFEYDFQEMNENGKALITNYDEIMDSIFTENGKKVYASRYNNLIEIIDGKPYMIAGDDTFGDFLKTYGIVDDDNIKIIDENTITCNPIREMYLVPPVLLEEGEEEESREVVDTLTIKKVDNVWLIDDIVLAE